MRSTKDDRGELDAIAEMIAGCRDSARTRRLDALTYQLDMALVAACSDLASLDAGSRPEAAVNACIGTSRTTVGRLRTALDLSMIRSTVLACRDRAEDIGRSTLVYMLDVVLIAVERAVTD